MASFWEDRLEAAKAELIQLDETLASYANGVQSSSLDTGQTRVTKSKFEIASMVSRQKYLLSLISTLEVRTGQSSGSFGAKRC